MQIRSTRVQIPPCSPIHPSPGMTSISRVMGAAVFRRLTFCLSFGTEISRSGFAKGRSDPIWERHLDAEWSSPVARQAHNLEVGGSNPSSATKISHIVDFVTGIFPAHGPFVYRLGRQVFNLERGVRFSYGLPVTRITQMHSLWPVRLSVRTPDSQSGKRGSILPTGYQIRISRHSAGERSPPLLLSLMG